MFQPDAVCFCDIPVEDFGIHMEKYGSMGLSYQKSFLVRKGASPVFYVARDSVAKYDFREGQPAGEAHRGDFFDKQVFDFVGLHVQRRQWAEEKRVWEGVPDLLNHINALSHPSWFLHYHVFAFLKCFDSTLSEDHRDNFYMEREWRIAGDISFSLDDVWRVILPRDWVRKFRSDIPDYNGQITFAT